MRRFCATVVGVLLVGCATSTLSRDEAPMADPPSDASAPEATPPCSDCYYPKACSDETFCPEQATEGIAATLTAVAGRPDGDLWVSGNLGTIVRGDGSSMSRQSLGAETFSAIAVRGSGEVWLGGSLRSSYVRTDPPASGSIQGWLPVGATDIEQNSLGSYRSHMAMEISGLWTAPESAYVWASLIVAERRHIYRDPEPPCISRLHREKSVLVHEDIRDAARPCQTLQAIVGIRRYDEVWAVGQHGASFRVEEADGAHPRGGLWQTGTENTLFTVDASAEGELLAAGAAGIVLRFDRGDGAWRPFTPIPGGTTLRGLKVTAPDDIWAAGDGATIFHYDGSRWSQMPIGGLIDGRRPDLYAIHRTPNKLYVVGDKIVLSLDLDGG